MHLGGITRGWMSSSIAPPSFNDVACVHAACGSYICSSTALMTVHSWRWFLTAVAPLHRVRSRGPTTRWRWLCPPSNLSYCSWHGRAFLMLQVLKALPQEAQSLSTEGLALFPYPKVGTTNVGATVRSVVGISHSSKLVSALNALTRTTRRANEVNRELPAHA